MSLPREVLRGTTYLLKRETVLGFKLLEPNAAVTGIILYLLAVTAPRYSIQVHALCAMATHLQLVVTDVEGRLPKFIEYFHRMVALAIQVACKWEGSVWDKRRTEEVPLLTCEALVQSVAHVLASPVEAGLVAHASEWPGAKALVEEVGVGVLHATRPTAYLSTTNKSWPALAKLALTLPAAITDAEAFRRQVAEVMARAEAKAARVEGEAGALPQAMEGKAAPADEEAPPPQHQQQEVQAITPQQGVEREGGALPQSRATGREARQARKRLLDVIGDSAAAVVEAARAFHDKYRGAIERWCAGWRDTEFPPGTWWMSVFHHARVGIG